MQKLRVTDLNGQAWVSLDKAQYQNSLILILILIWQVDKPFSLIIYKSHQVSNLADLASVRLNICGDTKFELTLLLAELQVDRLSWTNL